MKRIKLLKKENIVYHTNLAIMEHEEDLIEKVVDV